MLHTAGWLAVLVLSAVPLGRRQAGPHPLEDRPVALAFAWPDEGAVDVRVERVRERARLVQTYRLRWRADPEQGGWVFSTDRVRLGELAGPSATGVRRVLARTALPSAWRVDADGAWAGSLPVDRAEALASFADALEQRGVPPSVLDAMRSERFAARDASAEDWWLLVGLWHGIELAPGTAIGGRDRVPVLGAVFPARYEIGVDQRLEHAGADCARVSYVQTIAGDEAKLVLERLLADADGEATAGARYRSVERTFRVEALVEIDGLRPHRVETRVEMRFTRLDGTVVEDAETARYELAWRAAGSEGE